MFEETKTLTGRLGMWASTMDKQEMRGLPTRLVSDLSEAKAEIERLREALSPFAEAWKTVTSNEAVVRSCSLGQIGHLCECEISGVHFQLAAAALQPST